MRIKVPTARLGLVTGLAAVLVLTALLPAFGTPAALAHSSLRSLGGLRPLATQEYDLPAGTRAEGVLAADDEQDWRVVVHKGQSVDLTLRTMAGYSGQAWISAFDALATTNTVAPLSGLGVVNGVGSSRLTSFTVPYDTVMAISVCAPAPAFGAYAFDYRISDPPATSTITRVSGATRFDTAVKISQSVFATSSTAIVATGRNFADALAASGLSGSYDCPVLLTGPGTLSAGVDAEITRLGAKKVFVIGSPTAVSDDVFNALNHGGRTVTRLQGANRFATAAAISQEIRAHETAAGRTPSNEAFVVNGLNYPDALAVSPFAFAMKMPILLVTPTTVPTVTATEILSMSATQTYVIGGPSAVSTATLQALPSAATRIAGTGRMQTAIAAAEFAVSQGWAGWSHVGLTTGWNYPDALAGGAALGKQGGVLLLSQPTKMPKDLYKTLYDNRASITDVKIFGSTVAVFGSVSGSAEHALLADPWVDPYGFKYTAR
jgi:putative cell wall-binding protein